MRILFVFVCVAAIVAFLKLHYIGVSTKIASDYAGYVQAAQFFSGMPMQAPPLSRILKPLNPLLVAALAPLVGDEKAFVFQAVFFYLAFTVAMYLLAYEFFMDHRKAVLVTALAIFCYPVMKYGIELLTETGAWFFYTISLWLSLRFLKAPNIRLVIINALLCAAGFLWKEYSIVAAGTFGLVILFHPKFANKQKIFYLATLASICLCCTVPWLAYVYTRYHYSYLTWYRTGGATGFALGFTLHNLSKSTAAVLGLAWLLVFFGLFEWRSLENWQRRFLALSFPLTLLSYAWGSVDSRLFFVMAPPLLLLGVWGMQRWPQWLQATVTFFVIMTNILWLVFSYSVAV